MEFNWYKQLRKQQDVLTKGLRNLMAKCTLSFLSSLNDQTVTNFEFYLSRTNISIKFKKNSLSTDILYRNISSGQVKFDIGNCLIIK